MKVLIAGGSGFIGKSLSKLLVEDGFEVAILTRNPQSPYNSGVKEFYWNLQSGSINIEAFNGVDVLINLAGENIGAKRWSGAQKQLIELSRLSSSQLLFITVASLPVKPKVYISASAIGLYGYDRGEQPMVESDSCGVDFLAQVCQKWEQEAFRFQELGLRTCCVRTGIVLSNTGGALKQILASLRFNVLFRFGSGNQPFPWIDIVDLCGVYKFLIKSTVSSGVYNATAPVCDNFNDVLNSIVRHQSKGVFVLMFPKFLLKLLFGKMATILLCGSNISSLKIMDQGFVFRSNSVSDVLRQH